MKTLFLALIIVPLVTFAAASEEQPFTEVSVGHNIVSGRLNTGDIINIDINIVQYSGGWPLDLEHGYFWGAEIHPPKHFIKSLEIKDGKDEVAVPVSAFSNLTNVYGVELVPENETCMLLIRGGSAATSYIAELALNKGKLIRKNVHSCEFPETVFERATYSIFAFDDPKQLNTDFCVKDPDNLFDHISNNFKNFRIPQEVDVFGDWKEYAEYNSTPFQSCGDYNNDGLEDTAIILISEDKWKLVLFEQNKNGTFKTTVLDKGKDTPQKYNVDTLKANEEINCYHCDGKDILSFPTDTITFFMYESAGSVFYWDAEKKEYERIWISD